MAFDRRGTLPLIVGGAVCAAVAVVVVVVLEARSGDEARDCAPPSANAAGTTATATGETYWNEERMRNAEPVHPAHERTDTTTSCE